MSEHILWGSMDWGMSSADRPTTGCDRGVGDQADVTRLRRLYLKAIQGHDELATENQELHDQIARLEARVEELEKELDVRRACDSSIDAGIMVMEQKIANAAARVAELDDENTSLKARVKGLKQVIASLTPVPPEIPNSSPRHGSGKEAGDE